MIVLSSLPLNNHLHSEQKDISDYFLRHPSVLIKNYLASSHQVSWPTLDSNQFQTPFGKYHYIGDNVIASGSFSAVPVQTFFAPFLIYTWLKDHRESAGKLCCSPRLARYQYSILNVLVRHTHPCRIPTGLVNPALNRRSDPQRSFINTGYC